MTDLIKLELRAGDGGHGRVSFRREKYVPKGGPDGGDGGDGGSIILVGSKHMSTLDKYVGKTMIEAKDGQIGGKKQMIGANADDVRIEVPVGTIVWLISENTISHKNRQFSHLKDPLEKYIFSKDAHGIPSRESDVVAQDDLRSLRDTDFRQVKKEKLVEIEYDGQEIVLCRGGRGGRGNKRFASAGNRTPLEAEYGEFGERKMVVLEHKLLADVGLVGYPNAGKSTFLSVVTKARPKIANYPFTTLEPNLGVVENSSMSDKKEIVIADIPGLIEGASQGKGLGYAFLRHIEHCRVLVFILSLDEVEVFDKEKTLTQKAETLWQRFEDLQGELADYSDELAGKKVIIAVSKSDLYSPELREEVEKVFESRIPTSLKLHGTGTDYDKATSTVNFISSVTRSGLDEFIALLMKQV